MLMKRPPKSMRGMRSGVMTSRATGRLPAAHDMKYPEKNHCYRLMYRVVQVVVDLGWVNIGFGNSTTCPVLLE